MKDLLSKLFKDKYNFGVHEETSEYYFFEYISYSEMLKEQYLPMMKNMIPKGVTLLNKIPL